MKQLKNNTERKYITSYWYVRALIVSDLTMGIPR